MTLRYRVHGTRGSWIKHHLDPQEAQIWHLGMTPQDEGYGLEDESHFNDQTLRRVLLHKQAHPFTCSLNPSGRHGMRLTDTCDIAVRVLIYAAEKEGALFRIETAARGIMTLEATQ